MALTGLRKFITKIQRFNAERELQNTLVRDSKDIVNSVKINLSRGLDGNDEPVYLIRHGSKQYTYAIRTIQNKDIFGVGLGSVTENITNYKSGAFYNSIYLQVNSDGTFQVLSSDSKFELIKYRSGEAIINLSPTMELFLLEEKIAPLLQAEIDEIFNE